MILPFEADKTFNCPPGNHRATLYEVKEQRKWAKEGVDVFVRFVFSIDELCNETKTVVAGKNFIPTLNQGGELRFMLEIWLGEKFVEEQQKTGNWNLKTLEGKKADLVMDGEDHRLYPYDRRYLALMNLLAKAMQRNVILAETAFTPQQKVQLLKQLHRQNKEGIVFKALEAPYTPGRPNSGGSQLKHKFYATLSAVVANVNDRRSVEVRLLNGKGWVPCGNVTIPPNFQIPQIGQVVEIRYLYAFQESKALYQPVYLGPRNDVEPFECGLSQLKYKATEEEELC